jgi:RNA polymerase sigma-70 factor, ECF subfamily
MMPMESDWCAEVAPGPEYEAAIDEALVARARSDPEAFGRLYDRYLHRVYRLAYRCTGNHADAEDLTSRTFHRALEALPRYEWRGLPFGAWLLRITRNLATDRFRRARPALSLDGLSDAGYEPPGDGQPLDADLLRQEDADAAWAAVAELPALQRRAVTLYFGRGLSHADVGRTIGRSEPATKQLVYRAVKTLRARLLTDDERGGA